MLDLDNISHNCCPLPKGVPWPWPKVISRRSRSQYTHSLNLCQTHNSLLSCLIWMILNTMVSWLSLLVISPRSRSQFTHNENLFLGQYLSQVTWIGIILYTIVVHDRGLLLLEEGGGGGGICPIRTCLVIITSSLPSWKTIKYKAICAAQKWPPFAYWSNSCFLFCHNPLHIER